MNRSSTPSAKAPRAKKPVHTPNPGVAEAQTPFIRDGAPLPMVLVATLEENTAEMESLRAFLRELS